MDAYAAVALGRSAAAFFALGQPAAGSAKILHSGISRLELLAHLVAHRAEWDRPRRRTISRGLMTMATLNEIAKAVGHLEAVGQKAKLLGITVVRAKARREEGEAFIELAGRLSLVEHLMELIQRERPLCEMRIRETVPAGVDPEESRTWTLLVKV